MTQHQSQAGELPGAYRLSADEVARRLGVDPERGLDPGGVPARLEKYGPNELQGTPPTPAWKRFAAQFQDTLVALLLLAVAISVGLWLYERDTALPYEGLTILTIVLLNAALGFVQEARAEQAVAALKAMSTASAHVLRGGVVLPVPAREVVPGDVLVLSEGDAVSADARLVQTVELSTLEASLTGESLPVAKDTVPIRDEVVPGDQRSMVFAGSAVSRGHGRAIVTATGMQTALGQIAGLLHSTVPDTTPLQRELNRVGKRLGAVVVVIALIMIVTLALVNGVRTLSGFADILILGVALAVAAVPEGLPAITSVVLALGMQRMARRNAIVRRLPAVETLGSATVIASDKTGTLTRNEMTVQTLITGSGEVTVGGVGYEPVGEMQQADGQRITENQQAELEKLLTAAALNNNATLRQEAGQWQISGDPTEAALLVAAHKAGLTGEQLNARWERLNERPFSAESKSMSTLYRNKETHDVRLFSKGAPDVLLKKCVSEWRDGQALPLSEARRAYWRDAERRLASQAFRSLGVATRRVPEGEIPPNLEPLEHDLTWLGLLGMLDPPRDEVKDAVARTHRAGIRTLMITGDHPLTAGAIAAELGIAPASAPVLTGQQIAALNDTELDQVVRDTNVYARVDPEHKLRIVQALQRDGEVVAMTGDGVNDAPALKAADIGVAMGITGTDVSKEAADIVLADDHFNSIVAAVREGRTIFSNIRKFLRYLLSSNIGEVMTMFFGVVFAGWLGLRGEPGQVVLPLLAVHILWINLVTDGAPALALGLERAQAGVMNRPPRPKHQSVITTSMWRGIFITGLTVAVGTLAVLDASLPGGLLAGEGNLTHGRSMAFTTLMFFQVFNVFNARSDRASAFQGLFRNRWLWAALFLSVALQALVVNWPPLQRAFSTTALSLNDWLFCAAVASSVIWVREIEKLVIRLLTPSQQ